MNLLNDLLFVALDKVLKGQKTDDVVKQTAEVIHKNAQDRFLKNGDRLERTFVNEVLLPLCLELSVDDKTQFLADLNTFKARIMTNVKEDGRVPGNRGRFGHERTR